MKDTVRLQAYLASCGLGSRRFCEGFIERGRVKVNGIPAVLGAKVGAGDRVELDDRLVEPQARLRYIALNKPPGYISSMADEKNRPVAASLLKSSVPERVYNIGRLDQWSSGLLFFTNDGDFASLLVHPRSCIDKEYLVRCDLPIPGDFPERFMKGLEIEKVLYKAERVVLLDEKSMRIVLVEGKNREIRKVLGLFGLRALFLRRERIGPIDLGALAEGSYRDLDAAEVESLKAYSNSARQDSSVGLEKGRLR
ncbi:MAG: pseudouridine synthase [Spirochaetia bacterium]|jgi:23S rRNA pseudouridine2605 synthase|nr:pseudouridine synthase [Spirochaetia bacterium]